MDTVCETVNTEIQDVRHLTKHCLSNTNKQIILLFDVVDGGDGLSDWLQHIIGVGVHLIIFVIVSSRVI